MKSLTSMLGWLLLLAVLAVPSFLFYNWWTKSRQQTSSELAQEPVQANIFPSSEKAAPAAPPARSTAPAPSPEVQPGPKAAQESASQPAAATRPAAQQAAPARQPAPQQPAPQQPAPQPPAPASQPAQVQQSSAPARSVAVSTAPKPVSYYDPKTDRDPTLSPADYSKIKKLELERLEAARQARLAALHRPSEPTIESRLLLQGIIGNAAIINGDMYYAGQSVRGAKILKIGANYVILEYKGRRFRKVLR